MRIVDVRRLAAVDMHGARGTRLRCVVITAEFVLGATLGTAIGIFVAATAEGAGWQLFGAWVAGCCVNYVPLSIHALALFSDDALRAELATADIASELRYYTSAQLWIAVPLLFVILAVLQARRKRM